MHRPVLLREVVELMRARPGGLFVDATAGGGGHAEALLEAAGPDGRLLAVDRDEEAVGRVRERLARYGDRARVVHGNFEQLASRAKAEGVEAADGVLLDLGMSSWQVDEAGRGFSFQQDGPLDMRMTRQDGVTAEALVNGLPEAELADLLYRLGEEPAARRIARAVVRERQREPIRTTGRLASVVEAATGGKRGRIHPATRTFQALRMAVNRELECLGAGLAEALALLRPGGRLAVISFHRLEDAAVKRFLVAHEGRRVSRPQGGWAWVGEEPRVRRVTRKPVRPTEEEVAENPRARSARLRVAERSGNHGQES